MPASLQSHRSNNCVGKVKLFYFFNKAIRKKVFTTVPSL